MIDAAAQLQEAVRCVEAGRLAEADTTVPPSALGPLPVDPHADRYRIVDQLGEGGIGVVHRASDRRLGRGATLTRAHNVHTPTTQRGRAKRS